MNFQKRSKNVFMSINIPISPAVQIFFNPLASLSNFLPILKSAYIIYYNVVKCFWGVFWNKYLSSHVNSIKHSNYVYHIVASRSMSQWVTAHVKFNSTWGSKNKSCPNELKKRLLDVCQVYLQNLSILTNKKVLFLKKGHVSIQDFKKQKNLIFWIVTRASARDYMVYENWRSLLQVYENKNAPSKWISPHYHSAPNHKVISGTVVMSLAVKKGTTTYYQFNFFSK